MILNEALGALERGQDLSQENAKECLEEIFSGSQSEESIIKLLSLLKHKGESTSEILGFCKVLIDSCVSIDLPQDAIDLCGTGGSGLSRYNISTSSAFILASAGVSVAKHGNRGSKRSNGSFDFLEELGLPLDLSPEKQLEKFKEFHLCFFFARSHHPQMKHVGPARAKLGKRSIFNLIGPLCNPAQVPYQIIGVSDKKDGPKLAQCLQSLGRKKALVVCGEPGIDEFSLSGLSTYWEVTPENITKKQVSPKDLGLKEVTYDQLPGGDAAENAAIFKRLLKGDSCDGLQDMLALNAGAAFYLYGKTSNIREGIELALTRLKDGHVKSFYEKYTSS